MDFSTLKSLTIPEGEVKQIAYGDVILWKSGYTNLVPLSTEADGKTIYNGGLGYKDGYRIRSGGAEGTQNNGACTGFMPVKGGDVVLIFGWGRYNYPGSAANAINAANSSFENIGQISNANYGIFATGGSAAAYNNSTIVDNANGISTWVVPPASTGIAFIRVSAFGDVAKPGSSLIVTINEEIT